jgi:RES domain-containing protein
VILTRFDPARVFYRFLTPKWAFLPTSGAGAAQHGGRFNRPGIEALYLSVEVETAWAEYGQGSSLPSPGTLVAYTVMADDVVDFSSGFDPTLWSPEWAEWDADWKYIARIERKTPPSWRLADDLIRSGRRGLLYPSTRRRGGANLVLFSSNFTAGDTIEAHDPEGRLPTNQSSWP